MDINEFELIEFCKKITGDVYLYGAGECCQKILSLLNNKDVLISGIVVADKKDNSDRMKGIKVLAMDSVMPQYNDGVVIALGGHWDIKTVKEELIKSGFQKNNIFWQKVFFQSLKGVGSFDDKCGFFSDCFELDLIGEETGTDKCKNYHNYLNKYEFFLRPFRNKKTTILELGVKNGASVFMWKKYFKNAWIIGVDIDEKCEKYEDDNIQIKIGDLGNSRFVESLKEVKADVIVDDASHFWSHQIDALINLFPSLSRGGVYIVEDITTSYVEKDIYGDYFVSAYDFCNAISECVTGNMPLQKGKHLYGLSLLEQEIEGIAASVEMICFIFGSCIIIKK